MTRPFVVEHRGQRFEGPAVDLPGADPRSLVAAIRGEVESPTVACPAPGRVHEYVGLIEPGIEVEIRPALAAAARSRGIESPQRPELERVRERLAEIDPPAVSLREERRRVATAGDREDELAERVARLQGRVATLRERGDEPGEAADRLDAATRELTEARTERIAAEQALRRARKRAREARNRRERRLELQDRAGNLRRAAREYLIEEVNGTFEEAIAAVPGEGRIDGDEFEGDPITAALAVTRVADVAAPVVLTPRRFETAAAAADCLDAPVVRV